MKIGESSRWDLLALAPLLFGSAFLPWAQGGNEDSTVNLLTSTVGLGFGIWVIGLIFERRRPQIPLWWYPCFATIMISGGVGLVDGSGTIPENPFILEHQNSVAGRWPGSWIVDSGREWFFTCALSLLGLAASTDIFRRNRDWLRPAAVILLVGAGGMASAGLLAGGAVEWMFRDPIELPGQPFGGFFHYSLAGAYFNLVWPLGFAFVVATRRRERAKFGFWAAALLTIVTYAAIWTLPTVAAKALSLALLMALLLAWAESRQRGFHGFWIRASEHYGKKKAIGVLIASGLLLFVFLFATVIQPSIQGMGSVKASGPVPQRESPLPDRGDLMVPSEDPQAQLPLFDRRLSWATAASMLPDTGVFGVGPRAWKASYPEYTLDMFLLSFFLYIQFVHNDFLQYLVEWGWIGGMGWIALWLLILWTGFQALWRRLDGRGSWSQDDWITFAAWLGLGSCIVHAQVDFPLQSGGVLVAAVFCGSLVLADPSRPQQ
jgi:hypothetical protein